MSKGKSEKNQTIQSGFELNRRFFVHFENTSFLSRQGRKFLKANQKTKQKTHKNIKSACKKQRFVYFLLDIKQNHKRSWSEKRNIHKTVGMTTMKQNTK